MKCLKTSIGMVLAMLLLCVCSLDAKVATVGQDIPGYENENWFRCQTYGILRADQGTVQMTILPTQDLNQFGSTWNDFLFKMQPAQPTGNGYTLLGVYHPRLGFGQAGIRAITRG